MDAEALAKDLYQTAREEGDADWGVLDDDIKEGIRRLVRYVIERFGPAHRALCQARVVIRGGSIQGIESAIDDALRIAREGPGVEG